MRKSGLVGKRLDLIHSWWCVQARKQETRGEREEGHVPGQGSGEEEDGGIYLIIMLYSQSMMNAREGGEDQRK